MRWPLATCLCLACAPADDTAVDAAVEDVPGCDPTAKFWTVWVANQAEGVDAIFVVHPHDTDLVHIQDTIPVGRAPHNLAFTPDGRLAYVANLSSPVEPGTVSVIDTQSRAVIATVGAGVTPHSVRVTPDGRFAWVANIGSDDVTVIDTGTNETTRTMAVGDGPAQVAFTPTGVKGYVSNGDEGSVSAVDATTLAVLQRIPTGRGSMGLVTRQDGRFVFETEPLDDRLSIIDTTTDVVVTALTFGGTLRQPHGLALAGNELLVTNATAESLAFVDTTTFELTGSVAVSGRPQLVAVSPDCTRAYLTLRDSPAVSVVDIRERRVLGTIDLGEGSVHGIAVLPPAGATP